MCHIKEYAEYINRKQRQDHCTDHTDNDILKITCCILQCIVFSWASPSPKVKASTSAVITFMSGGMATEKKRQYPLRFTDLFQRGTGLYQVRKYSYSCKVREKPEKTGLLRKLSVR